MELVVPFMLVIIGWSPDNPGDTMALQQSLYASQEVCEAQGLAFIEEHKDMETGNFPAKYKYFCIPAPTADEYQGVLEQQK